MIKQLLCAFALLAPVSVFAAPQAAGKTADAAKPAAEVAATGKPRVLLHTTQGDITVELNPDKAPKTVDNFLQYVKEGFYDGTIFHRVIPRFMAQGGGWTKDLQRKRAHAPIRNEANNGLKNTRGTLSMARTSDVNSATSQFFVNLADNAFLDHGTRDYGYAVFGRIASGMDVIDRIASVRTGTRKGYQDAPLEDVVIVSARRLAPA